MFCFARNVLFVAWSCLLLSCLRSSGGEVTITEDFEGLSLGSTATPDGWSYIDVTGLPNNSYSITNGYSGGLGARFTGDNSVNANQPPGCYIVNSDGPVFGTGPFLDLTKPISGSFQYYIDTDLSGGDSRAKGGIFIFGDIRNGIAGSTAGSYLGLQMMKDSFGNRGGVIDGAGNQVKSYVGNQNYLSWYTISFSWTPTNGVSGVFEASGSGSGSWSVAYSNYTFNVTQAYFGFGAGDYYNGSPVVYYDDISITGSPINPSGTVIIIK